MTGLKQTTGTFDYSAMFMKGKVRGIGYAHPVEWTTPLGEIIIGSVLINATLAIGKIYASKRMHTDESTFTWKDPFVIEHSRIDIVEDFEHDFVVHLTTKTMECKLSKQ